MTLFFQTHAGHYGHFNTTCMIMTIFAKKFNPKEPIIPHLSIIFSQIHYNLSSSTFNSKSSNS